MKVAMTFDESKVNATGYQMADIYETIKSEFTKRGLRCTSEDRVLSFEDTGHEDDYAYMWNVIMSLLKSDWFVACASSCVFYDDDDTEEDVLCQAAEIRQMLA